MAGDLVVGTGEVVEGTIKHPRPSGEETSGQPYKFVYYWSGQPAGSGGSGTAGYISTTTEKELVVLDISGLKHFSLVIDNQGDDDIDGGGANAKALDVFVDLRNDPDFNATPVPVVDNITVASGATTTFVFGQGIRGWVQAAENYDFDGSTLVTIANEGFPFRFMKISLEAETEDAESYFEAFLYAL